MVKKLLIGVVLTVAALVGAAVLVPERVDWDRWREPLAAALGEAAGRPVILAGPLQLSLLPVPTLLAEAVTLAEVPGAAGPAALHLPRLEARLALLPLLGGRIEIERLRLLRPELVLAAPVAASGPATTVGLAAAVRLDRLEIEDGTLIWRRAGQPDERVEAITATLAAASLNGPFRGEGGFKARGLEWTLEASGGESTPGAPTPLRLALALPAAGAKARLAGIVTLGGGGGPRFQGDLRLEGPALAATLRALALGAPAGPLEQPFALHAMVAGSAQGLDFTGLELHLGGIAFNGGGRLVPGAEPALEARLAAGRIDLGPWLAAAWPAGGPAGFALPAGVRARLELAVEALEYRGGMLRQVRLEAGLAEGRLSLDRLAAQAPGGATLAVGGSLVAEAGRPVADLRLEAAADNLRATLDWLGLAPEGVAADRLRRLSLLGRLQGRPEDFQLSGLDLQLDTSRLTGGLAWRNPGRPAIGLRLELDHLDLDGYRPAGTAAGGAGAAWLPAGLELLGRGDANLLLKVGSLGLAGVSARALALDATLHHGALTLRQARVGDLAGLAAGVQGTVQALAPFTGADLRFEAETSGLETVNRALGLALPEALLRAGGLTLGGRVSGDAARLGLEATLAALGGTLQVGGAFDPGMGMAEPLAWRLSLAESGRLLRLVQPGLQFVADPGSTDLYGRLELTPGLARLEALQGSLAGVALSGHGLARFDGVRPWLEADLQAGELVPERFATAAAAPGAAAAGNGPPRRPTLWPGAPVPERRGGWSTEPLPFERLALVDGRFTLAAAGLALGGRRLTAPQLSARLKEGVLELERLEAGLLGGRFGLSGRVSRPETSGHLSAAGLRLDRIPLVQGGALPALAIEGGVADLELDLRSHGDSPAALIGALAGTGRMAVLDGGLAGIDLAGLSRRIGEIRRPQDIVAAAALIQGEGQTRFRRLDGTVLLDKGVATSQDLHLEGEAGSGSARGSVDLVQRLLDVSMEFRLAHEPPLPALGMSLTGPLDHPRRSFDTRELQSWLAQRLTGALFNRVLPEAAPGAIPASPDGLFKGLLQKLKR